MIGPADISAISELGISAILSLTARSPFPAGAPDGLDHLHLPVADMTCPAPDDQGRAVAFIRNSVETGRRVLVHCGAGYGRTGTVIACYLVAEGATPEDALQAVRSARPGSVETREQELGIVETQFCRKCSPGTKAPLVGLSVQLEGEKQPHLCWGVDRIDIRLLEAFIAGKQKYATGNDAEVPLKNAIGRLEELLGVKVKAP